MTLCCQKTALYLSGIIHDIDHRGYNNAFMIKNKSPLSHLYSTSTMEWHHFKQGVFILEVCVIVFWITNVRSEWKGGWLHGSPPFYGSSVRGRALARDIMFCS